MIISSEHRFVYLPTPRCASTTLSELMISEYGGVYAGSKHDIAPEPNWYKKMTVWSVVRHPLDRLISIFEYIRDGKMGPHWRDACKTESEFLAFYTGQRRFKPNVIFRSQAFFLEQCPAEVSYLLYLDNLHEGVYNLPFVRTTVANLKLPQLNMAPRRAEEYFVRTETDYDLANTVCRKDCLAFGFKERT